MSWEGIGLIDSFIVNNLSGKICIFIHVLSVDKWIYIHLFAIHNPSFNSLSIAVCIFLWSAQFRVLLHVICGDHQSNLDNFWVLTERLMLWNRDLLLLFFVATWEYGSLSIKRARIPSFARKWTWSSRGSCLDLQWMWVHFSVCKSVLVKDSVMWLSCLCTLLFLL